VTSTPSGNEAPPPGLAARTERRRLGLIVPSSNATAEPDFNAAVPSGVTVHSTRVWMDWDPNNEASMDAMNAQLEGAARSLASCGIEVVCMAGTTNSFYRGSGGSRSNEELMSRGAGGIPAVSSSPSIVLALRHFGVHRISVATPYPEWNNAQLAKYFGASGFNVLNVEGDRRVIEGPTDRIASRVNSQDPEEIAEFALSICRPGAEAVVCSCSAWRAMEAADEIERRTDLPCLTTNQATLWRTLRTMSILEAKPGFGRVLTEMPALSEPASTTT
jgi:maleate isomerase